MTPSLLTILYVQDLPAARVDGCPRAEGYLCVDDLDQAVARLEALGARCTGPRARRDWGDEAAYYLDQDGYVLAVARSGRG